MAALSFTSSHHPIPRRPGSSTDLGPFLDVVTWILLITSALAVVTRLITKRALRRRIDVDDAFVILALITSVASGVTVTTQTENGLGRDITSLTEKQLLSYHKAEYANSMLYIATLGFAKLSIISLLMILTASRKHRNLILALGSFMALWAAISVCTAAFQCGVDTPWRVDGKEKCFNKYIFWRAMGAINILTDLILIAFPVHIVMTLQMSLGKKTTILAFFGARSLDIVATAVQMVFLDGFSSPNHSRDLWKWTLLGQIVECITIITSCIPYIRPLLEAVPSGLYATDGPRRRGTLSERGGSRSKSSKSSYGQLSSIASKFNARLSKPSRTYHPTRSIGIKRPCPARTQEKTTHANSASGIPGGPRRLDGETDVEITATHHKYGDDRRWDTGSTASHARILKTTVVSAEWEEIDVRGCDTLSDEIEAMR